MNIQINGETQQFPDSLTVTQLLEALQINGKRIAVELNQQIVPRSAHDTQMVEDGDHLEIVHAIGGG